MVNGTPWLLFMYYVSLFAYALRSLSHNEFYAPEYTIYPTKSFTSSVFLDGNSSVGFFSTKVNAATLTATYLPGVMSTANAVLPAVIPGFTSGCVNSAILASGSGQLLGNASVCTYLNVPIKSITTQGISSPYLSADVCADSLLGQLCDTSASLGVSLMRQLNVDLQHGWKWGGVGVVIFFAIFANVISSLALAGADPQRNVGTTRTKDAEEPAEASADAEAKADDAVPVVVEPKGSAQSVLPFEPMTVAWRNLTYTVQLNKNLGGGSKVLLQGVSGIASPGKLLALMGASGAGKSTLLDVIAGRKTGGTMEGDIFLNGFAKETKSFARLTAYCEQVDVHNTFATVREALHFSASLRLPDGVSGATKNAFVEEVLDLLELRSIADRLIGETGSANGLAPGQRKILTVGVELVSNAPILFLDVRPRPIQCLCRPSHSPAPPPQEPTSGLDSRAAALVIGVVRNIASTGRTVITTIHQPNSDIFFKFDEARCSAAGQYPFFRPSHSTFPSRRRSC